MIPALLLLGGDGLGLEHPLDDVGLLDEESSGDPVERGARAIRISTSILVHLGRRKPCIDLPVLDTPSTPRSTVSPLNGLLPLGQGSVFPGPESGNTGESETTVTTLGSALSSTYITFQIVSISLRCTCGCRSRDDDSRPTSSSGGQRAFHQGSSRLSFGQRWCCTEYAFGG